MSRTIPMPKARAGSAGLQPQKVAGQFILLRLRTLKGQFTLHAGLILLFAATLTLVGTTTLSRATSDLTTIESGSIPSVDAAQAITQYIEVIDAQSADYLATAGLTNTAPCTIAGFSTISTTQTLTIHDCDEHNIDTEIVLVNQQLFEAAHNVTYLGEQTAVERITIGLESYLGDIHQMRVDYGLATNKIDPNDHSLQQAYQAYLNASAILHDRISLATLGTGQIPLSKETNLPNCTLSSGQTLTPAQWTRGGLTDALDCLRSINYAHLQAASTDSGNFLGGSTVLIAILCILLCVLLLFGTGRMMTASHRFINPGLLAATLISLIVSVNTVSLLSSLQGQSSQASQDGAFRQMVIDDYNSVYFAALLNRYGTDANADESRWLIAQEFHDQANLVHWQTDWDQNVQQIVSLMHKAHANQTWVEEIQPLKDMDTFWSQYHTIDGQIRSTTENLSDPHRLNDAESISTGKSNQAFGNFTNAVDRLSQANRDHYTQTLHETQGMLLRSFLLCLVLFPLAGLLAVWGIAIRLKDF